MFQFPDEGIGWWIQVSGTNRECLRKETALAIEMELLRDRVIVDYDRSLVCQTNSRKYERILFIYRFHIEEIIKSLESQKTNSLGLIEGVMYWLSVNLYISGEDVSWGGIGLSSCHHIVTISDTAKGIFVLMYLYFLYRSKGDRNSKIKVS
jgi:hypothetical protein